MHRRQLFDGFNELELVVVHQKIDGIPVCATAEAMVKLLFTVYGERGGFFVMKRTARMVVLALLFQLHPRVDEIDDVGPRQQVIDENAWDSSSHMPREFLATHKRKQAAHSFRKHGLTTITLSVN